MIHFLLLGHPVEDEELWAGKTFVELTRKQSRHVIVTHTDSAPLDVKVSIQGLLKPIEFLHHR